MVLPSHSGATCLNLDLSVVLLVRQPPYLSLIAPVCVSDFPKVQIQDLLSEISINKASRLFEWGSNQKTARVYAY